MPDTLCSVCDTICNDLFPTECILYSGEDVPGLEIKKGDKLTKVNVIVFTNLLSIRQEILNIYQASTLTFTALDVLNALTQTLPGKILDARQGKVLYDLIVALTTAVNTNTTNIATNTGAIAANTTSIATKAPQVGALDLEITDFNKGIILKTSDNTRGRLQLIKLSDGTLTLNVTAL